MRTYARLLTMLLLCDVHKPVAIILYDNANMQMHNNNNNNNIHICIAPYGRNFRGVLNRILNTLHDL